VSVLAGAGGASAADPVLTGDVGAGDGFTITLKDASGSPVTRLERGSYTLVVHDHSDFHNFRLSGPGVDVATEVQGTGDATFTVTLTDGTYVFQCDPHAAQMRGRLTVGTVATPPTTTTTAPTTPTPAVATKLVAAIGPGAKVSLSPASGLSAGSFAITVQDRSATDGFRLAGPGVTKTTGKAFMGTVTWRVSLQAGKYVFGSASRPTLRRAFTVSN
jgi:plastocyanin